MLIPLISFILGVLILTYSLLCYNNIPVIQFSPLAYRLKGNRTLTIGLGLISIGLMLGFVGYMGLVNSQTLRLLRLLLGLGGIGFIASHVTQGKVLKLLTLSNALKVLASILVIFLLIKCFIRVDANGDTWMYQLPFAARLWNLVTPEQYLMETERELVYDNFPKLANILQGFFWSIGGIKHPELANLVSFLSLIFYFIFLKFYLKIPLYLSTLAILAVPLIHIAATACYVDLLGNVGVAIVVLMTYLLYIKSDSDFVNWRNVIVFSLAGSLAANTKFLLVPTVGIFFSLAIIKIVITAFRKSLINLTNILKFLITGFLSGVVIFTTEFINFVQYQNPFYPLKVSVLGLTLNHAITPSSDYMSATLQAMNPIQRWIFSLLEIGAFDDRRPLPWTIAMDFVPLDSDTFGMGGYFAIYVIFNVILFAVLCRRLTKESNIALGFIILLSLITAKLPFSYQLRYYMYWIMVLIAVNLFLLNQETQWHRWLNGRTVGLIATAIIVIFGIRTQWAYTYPETYSMEQHLKDWTRPEYLSQLKPDHDYCLVSLSPQTFLYSSPFHQKGDYSIKAEFMISPEHVKEQCADRLIIAHESVKDQLNNL